jgi:UrcA family protein
VGLLVLVPLAWGVGAVAQRTGDPIFEITVVAPRLVRKDSERTPVGGKTELVSMTRRVTYDDLDLTVHADVLELEKRINDTAKETCGLLASVFPLSDPKTPDCVREAVDKAMVQARAAIAATRK